MPVFSKRCRLARIVSLDIQWSQLRLNASQPCVVGSSWGLFPVSWGLPDCSSNCMMMVIIRSTKLNVTKNCKVSLHRRLEERERPRCCLTSVCDIWWQWGILRTTKPFLQQNSTVLSCGAGQHMLTCIMATRLLLLLLLLVIAKILLLQHNQHFYLDVSVSVRDLHQKKFVQFLFRFLPW